MTKVSQQQNNYRFSVSLKDTPIMTYKWSKKCTSYVFYDQLNISLVTNLSTFLSVTLDPMYLQAYTVFLKAHKSKLLHLTWTLWAKCSTQALQLKLSLSVKNSHVWHQYWKFILPLKRKLLPSTNAFLNYCINIRLENIIIHQSL